MNKITYKTWLKLTVWALVIHVILIVLSILEVFIYSLINPSHKDGFYKEHAEFTGPYISMFFGFILFYLVARLISKKITKNKIVIALGLPIIYTIMDFLMVHYSGVNWKEHINVFIISALVKTLGSILGTFYGGSKKQKLY